MKLKTLLEDLEILEIKGNLDIEKEIKNKKNSLSAVFRKLDSAI